MLGSVYDRFHPEDWDEYCEEQEKEDTNIDASCKCCKNCAHLLRVIKNYNALNPGKYGVIGHVCYSPCVDDDYDMCYIMENITGPVECDAYDPIDDDE